MDPIRDLELLQVEIEVDPNRDLELLPVEMEVEYPMGCPLIFHSSVRHSPTWNLGVVRKQSGVCVDVTDAQQFDPLHSYSRSLLEVGSCCEVLASTKEFVPRRLYLLGRHRYHVVRRHLEIRNDFLVL